MSTRIKEWSRKNRLERDWWIAVASQIPEDIGWDWIEELHGYDLKEKQYVTCYTCWGVCRGGCTGDELMPLPMYSFLDDTLICRIHVEEAPLWYVIKAVNWVQKHGKLPDPPNYV